MEEKGNAGHVLFLHFKSLQFFSVKLSISFLPSYPILFCQAKYFCQGGAKAPPAPPLGTPMCNVKVIACDTDNDNKMCVRDTTDITMVKNLHGI